MKTFTIISGGDEFCLRCASLGRETAAHVAVKEVVKGVLVHSALCEEHFLTVEQRKEQRSPRQGRRFLGIF